MIPQSVRDQIRKEAEEKHPGRWLYNRDLRKAHIEAAEAMWIKCNAEAIPKSEVEKMLRDLWDEGLLTIGRDFKAISAKYGFDLSPKSNTQQTEPGS